MNKQKKNNFNKIYLIKYCIDNRYKDNNLPKS